MSEKKYMVAVEYIAYVYAKNEEEAKDKAIEKVDKDMDIHVFEVDK